LIALGKAMLDGGKMNSKTDNSRPGPSDALVFFAVKKYDVSNTIKAAE
jgi:hypothetical protein